MLDVVKTIKGVDDSTWSRFKVLAVQEHKPMGDMFKKLVEEYKKEADEFWDKVLNGPRLLTDKEAKDLLKTVSDIRKEKGWRI